MLGLTAQEPDPAVNLLKVPVWGKKDAFLVLGLPGETPTSGPSGCPRSTWCSGRAPRAGWEDRGGAVPGRRSCALEIRKGVLVLEKADWELHRVVAEVRLYPDEERPSPQPQRGRYRTAFSSSSGLAVARRRSRSALGPPFPR